MPENQKSESSTRRRTILKATGSIAGVYSIGTSVAAASNRTVRLVDTVVRYQTEIDTNEEKLKEVEIDELKAHRVEPDGESLVLYSWLLPDSERRIIKESEHVIWNGRYQKARGQTTRGGQSQKGHTPLQEQRPLGIIPHEVTDDFRSSKGLTLAEQIKPPDAHVKRERDDISVVANGQSMHVTPGGSQTMVLPDQSVTVSTYGPATEGKDVTVKPKITALDHGVLKIVEKQR